MEWNKQSFWKKEIIYGRLIPAVVVPFFLNTGFSFARSDIIALGLIPSSTEIVTGFSSPVLGSTIFLNKMFISARSEIQDQSYT